MRADPAELLRALSGHPVDCDIGHVAGPGDGRRACASVSGCRGEAKCLARWTRATAPFSSKAFWPSCELTISTSSLRPAGMPVICGNVGVLPVRFQLQGRLWLAGGERLQFGIPASRSTTKPGISWTSAW